MSLSPEQFADQTPMYHGFGERPDGDLLFPGRTMGRTDYTASDPNKVYATPDEGLAWDYAEHKSTTKLGMMPPALREATLNGPLAWSSDTTPRPGKPHPHVGEVKLAGAIDLDPNFAKHDVPVEKQKAFRGDLAEIVNVESMPKGAQASMLPHPKHGGRYTNDAPPKPRPTRTLDSELAKNRLAQEQFDQTQLKLFGDEVGRRQPQGRPSAHGRFDLESPL